MLTDDLVSDRRQLLDSAKELRDRFNAASDRWPSLRHVLVVVEGSLPNEVRGRRCMMQGDTDDGPTFDVTGRDFGSCLGAILQRKPANVSVSSLPIRLRHGGTDVSAQPAQFAMYLDTDSDVPLPREAAAHLEELSADAWHLLMTLPDESWHLLRLPPEHQHEANGVGNVAWIGDYRISDAEAQSRRWADEKGQLIAAPSAAERNQMCLSPLRAADGWLCAVHNLAWQQLPGTPYRAHRRTWSALRANSFLTFEHDFGASREHATGAFTVDRDLEFPAPLQWFRSDLQSNPLRASALALRLLVDPLRPPQPAPIANAEGSQGDARKWLRPTDMARKLSEAVGINLGTAKTRMTRAFEGNELTTRGKLGAWEGEEGSF